MLSALSHEDSTEEGTVHTVGLSSLYKCLRDTNVSYQGGMLPSKQTLSRLPPLRVATGAPRSCAESRQQSRLLACPWWTVGGSTAGSALRPEA